MKTIYRNMSGVLTISIDVELFWGTCDQRQLSEYGGNILGGLESIPLVLELFKRYDVHATWAFVGFLAYNDLAALNNSLPNPSPVYAEPGISTYDFLRNHGHTVDTRYLLMPEALRSISRTPHQEMASHSFSHLYGTDPGITDVDFEADLNSFKTAAASLGIHANSHVFPRNSYHPEHLAALAKYGFYAFRGNEQHWAYRSNSMSARLFRLTDAVINISGHHTYKLSDLPIDQNILNITASRFLRPITKRSWFDKAHTKRVINSMTAAAQQQSIFHLWWHPENFGANLFENIRRLDGLLKHFSKLRSQFDFQSLNMAEISALHARGQQ